MACGGVVVCRVRLFPLMVVRRAVEEDKEMAMAIYSTFDIQLSFLCPNALRMARGKTRE